MPDPLDGTTTEAPEVTPEVTPAPPAPPAKPASTQQGDQQVNWESRYKGLQTTYDKLQKNFDSLKVKHDETLGELEEMRQESKKIGAEKGTVDQRITELTAENAKLQEQLKSQEFRGERMKLIMGEFADLATFEADGLLPEAPTVEELKPKLESFRAKIGGTVDQSVKNKIQGVGATNTTRVNEPPGHTKEWVYDRLRMLSGHRTPEQEIEYQALRNEWDELNKPT
jgi:uncharacterized protein YukE